MTAFKSAFTSVKYHAITAPAIRLARRGIKGAAKHVKKRFSQAVAKNKTASKVKSALKGGSGGPATRPKRTTGDLTVAGAISRSKTFGELGRRMKVQATKRASTGILTPKDRLGRADVLRRLRKMSAGRGNVLRGEHRSNYAAREKIAIKHLNKKKP